MEIQFDLTELKTLQKNLNRLPAQLNDRIVRASLMTAAKPLAYEMQRQAPKGKGYERVSLSRGRGRSNDYRRGGATRADIRIKGVNDRLGEAKIIVGVSKAPGKVGWRTYFIIAGNAGTRRIAPNDFLNRALNLTKYEVVAWFRVDMQQRIKAAMKRLKIIP